MENLLQILACYFPNNFHHLLKIKKSSNTKTVMFNCQKAQVLALIWTKTRSKKLHKKVLFGATRHGRTMTGPSPNGKHLSELVDVG